MYSFFLERRIAIIAIATKTKGIVIQKIIGIFFVIDSCSCSCGIVGCCVELLVVSSTCVVWFSFIWVTWASDDSTWTDNAFDFSED